MTGSLWRWLWIGLAGLLLLFAVVLATFPAALAWRHLEERAPDLRLQGIEGSIWNGRAQRMALRGLTLGSLQWSLSPWSLPRGRPQLDWKLDGPGLELSARTTVLGQEILLEQFSGEAEAGWLGPALAIPALEPTGRLRSEGAMLRLSADGLPLDVDAIIDWLDAGVRGQAVARLGSMRIEARGRDGDIHVRVEDGGDGDLEVRGTARLQGRQYRSEVRLLPRVAEGPVVEALQWVGEPSADGGRLLLIEGEILQPEEVL